jgi:hypothetical protein
MNVSSTQSATAYGYGQVQRQQAQNNAAKLEAKAATLAAAAQSARKDADDAVRRAGEIEIQAGSARSSAISARQAASTGVSAIEAGESIGKRADRIYESMKSADEAKKVYDRYGRSSSSPYAVGSIFDISE